MRYAVARCKSWEREEAYRIYVTDRLYSLTGAKGIRYLDAVEEKHEQPEMSAEDIIATIRGKLS